MKIGIFGSSCNPIHKGHIKIIKYAIKKYKFEKFFIVPNYKNSFKKKINYVNDEHRIKMIELVKPSNVEIDFFEINKKNTSYTYETIDYFKEKFPNDKLYFIMGSDNIYKLHTWKNIDKMITKCQIIIFKRNNFFHHENINKYSLKILDNPFFNFSSTEFKKGNFEILNPKVKNYITKNYLYTKDILFYMVNDLKRYNHCLEVAQLASEYAKILKINQKKAWIAGLFHDVTKTKSLKWHQIYLKNENIDISKLEYHQLHSISSYLWTKNEYGITDPKILDSIKKHTNLDFKLSKMDKIIYAADKLEKNRNFQDLEIIRKIIKNNFEEGFKKIVKINFEKLLKKNIKISEIQKKIYKKWI